MKAIYRKDPARLTPWLVGRSDLQRYHGRALDQCARGRVIFFYHTIRSGPKRGQRRLLALTPVNEDDTGFNDVMAVYWPGPFRRVKLAALPSIRRPKNR